MQLGCVLVRNAVPLVSARTGLTAVAFVKKRLLAKAQTHPDLVRKVVEKARTDGPMSALQAAGCRVLGVDLEASRAALARALGLDAVCDPSGAVDLR